MFGPPRFYLTRPIEEETMTDNYRDEDEIAAVVRGFETCTTPAAEFTHRSHLIVATCYLSEGSISEALPRMREGLFRFVDHWGVSRAKYNETVTVFWLKIVERFLERLDPDASLVQRVNLVIETFGNSRLAFDYYSEQLLRSEKARRTWVEPDLKPLA
jgi:hypothetical protein